MEKTTKYYITIPIIDPIFINDTELLYWSLSLTIIIMLFIQRHISLSKPITVNRTAILSMNNDKLVCTLIEKCR